MTNDIWPGQPKIVECSSMEDLLLAIAVVILALGGLLGVAYSLDVHGSRHGSFGRRLRPPGPVGRALWWTARVLVAAMTITVASAHLFRVPSWAWLTLVGFALFVIDHTAYRIVRITGK